MRKMLTLALFASTLILAACGGGGESAAPQAAAPQAAAKAMMAQARPLSKPPMATVSATGQAEQLLNQAEKSFSAYFPEAQVTGFAGPFAYRHYSNDIYLGVVIQEGAGFQYLGVYVVGSVFGNSLANPIYAGQVSQFVTIVDPSLSAGTLVISNATNSARNGSFVPQVARGSSTGTDIDITGATQDGLFEMDVLFTAAGAIKNATVWYYNGPQITFYGCDNSVVAKSCGSAVMYDAASAQIRFDAAIFANSENASDTVTITGSVSAQ